MPKNFLESIFRKGLNAVDPENAVLRYVRREENVLYVDEKHYEDRKSVV